MANEGYGRDRRFEDRPRQGMRPVRLDRDYDDRARQASEDGRSYRRDGDYYGSDRDNWATMEGGYQNWEGGYGDGGRSYRGGDYGRSSRSYEDNGERGFMDRAGDEVASWFGDEDAARRREIDQYRGKGPKGYKRSDDRIREDVNDRLTDDPWLDASAIEVAVEAGEVTLTGTINRRQDKRRAEDCADSVSGVTHVQNNLRIQQADSSSTAAAL